MASNLGPIYVYQCCYIRGEHEDQTLPELVEEPRQDPVRSAAHLATPVSWLVKGLPPLLECRKVPRTAWIPSAILAPRVLTERRRRTNPVDLAAQRWSQTARQRWSTLSLFCPRSEGLSRDDSFFLREG